MVAADIRVAVGVAHIDVEKPVTGEVRVEGEAKQAAFVVARDLA
jgi:hypothetical protein